MQHIDFQDYTVIVRSVGERTEEKCIERLRHFFQTDDIKVVKNVTPFTAAIRKSFEMAIKDGKKWCWVVDADMLFYNDKLRIFFDNCNRIRDMDENAFCFQAYFYDNFFEECRQGMHLYSTKWLKMAMPFIDNDKGRPESQVIRNMGWRGYPCYVVETCIGIHDFFQFYRDIVAKGMLHAQKHSNIEKLIEKWEKEERSNKDYVWILKGARLIQNYKTDGVKVDASYYRKIIAETGIVFPEQDVLENEEIEDKLKKTCEIECYHQLIVPKSESLSKRRSLIEYIKNKILR